MMQNDIFLPAPEKSPVTSNFLKIAALAFMLIDHIGAAVFPDYRFLRYIGRLAFPIFIFLLTEGFVYTHNRMLYLMRLFAFSAISELGFDMAIYGKIFYPNKCNVFFTLSLGFCVMLLEEYIYKADKGTFRYPVIIYASFLGIIACVLLGDFLKTDYGSYGVLAIGGCFVCRLLGLHRLLCFAAACGILYASNTSIEQWTFLAMPLIWLYNGRLGIKNRLIQYGAYLFYPIHLMILGYIRIYL